MKQNIFSHLKNENGSTIIIAMLILVVLTIIGLAANQTSVTEIQIAANDKNYKISFHNADSGVFTIPKIISEAIDTKSTPNIGNPAPFTYFDTGTNDSNGRTLFRELAGFETYDTAADISFQSDGINNIIVDIERLRSITLIGGGAEFASGAEGAGTSMKGIYFGLDSIGSGPDNSSTTIGATYLKVVGAAGGL
ncbi:MAG: pilus assembly PilX N-terminal domain-containing protein [Proteobacteria bacterium]|nr:pilus assembly PilX N-terminal domain-containing protein [Pseudomonadota bacterium]MBU1582583.1 pilus assembly PilX N-terminal domain-containing protein [Pseudomonadota bacterium]MBU2455480.1 pilus assembly PilX N-terminal domain-containing protein [Pseudomonadota bacterium]MBU2630212.1 pilus assembly PilX N-terminal domain-containing protein [Pseudomonadota bacterium]